MLMRYEHRGVTWIDLERPTRDEVMLLMKEYSLDPNVAEELLLPSPKTRMEARKGYLYLIFHFPSFKHSHRRHDQEIDFVLGKNFIITTRYDVVDPLHKFSKVFDVNSLLEKSHLEEHAGYVFYYMMKRLYKSIEHEVSSIQEALDDIEEQIFTGKEREMVTALSTTSRSILDLRHAIEPHRDVLREFESVAGTFFDMQYQQYAHNLLNEYYRVYTYAARSLDWVRELRETNNSLLSTKQNELMKQFTILAFTTLPLSLVASVFGMNTVHTPLVESPFGFFYIIAIMACVGLGLFGFFKYKQWL